MRVNKEFFQEKLPVPCKRKKIELFPIFHETNNLTYLFH